MRTEVHVHGSVFFLRGVSRAQIEAALRSWLDYLDVDTIAEAKSLEQEEPGIVYDAKDHALDICWTGQVGRSFHECLAATMQALGPLTEYASEIEVTYYHDNGEDELQLMFVGPTPEAVHEAQRRRMAEDIAGLLGRHFGKNEVEQVTEIVNQLFAKDWEKKAATGEYSTTFADSPFPPRGKHLH